MLAAFSSGWGEDDLGQQMIDVLVPETGPVVLTVAYAAGQSMGPKLKRVTVPLLVASSSHHCVAAGGRQVGEFATDWP